MDTVVGDVRGYHQAVVKKFFGPDQGFESPPNIFLMAHSFGCQQLLNYLINFDHEIKTDNGICAKIQAVAFMAPFWEFASPSQLQLLLGLYQWRFKCSSEQALNRAYVFEQLEAASKHSDHVYHYVWNLGNRYQRRWIPLRTMISFEEEIQKIRAARKIPKDSDKNPYKKL